MKLVKEVRKYELLEGVKVGEMYRMEDTLSCDSFNAIIQEVTQTGIKIIKLPNMKTMLIGYNSLAKYDCKKLSLTDNQSTKENAKNEDMTQPLKEPTKAECEKAADEYGKHLMEALKEAFGTNVRVVNLAM